MSTQLDETLRNAAQHLLDATLQVETITPSKAFGKAVGEGRSCLKGALDAHGEAERALSEDRGENRAASASFEAARQAAIDEALWLKGALNSRLLHLRPEVMGGLGAGEVARRERLLSGLFGEELSSLRTAAGSMARTSLAGLASRLAAAVGSDVSADDVAPMLAKVAAVGTAFEAMLAEGLDDAPLAAALEEARGRLNACTQGLQRLLDGVLKLDGSPLSVEEFVRRRRRRGGSGEALVGGGAEPGNGGEVGGGATDA